METTQGNSSNRAAEAAMRDALSRVDPQSFDWEAYEGTYLGGCLDGLIDLWNSHMLIYNCRPSSNRPLDAHPGDHTSYSISILLISTAFQNGSTSRPPAYSQDAQHLRLPTGHRAPAHHLYRYATCGARRRVEWTGCYGRGGRREGRGGGYT